MTDDEVEQLIKEIEGPVRRLAQARYWHSPELIEELIQEHALDLWAMRGKLDTQRNPRQLAIRHFYLVCLRMQQRRVTRQPQLEPIDEAVVGVATGDESSHLRDMAVRQAFDKLPSHLWIVAWLVHGEGFLVSETARRLGLPKLLAEQRLSEATRLLQGMLKGWR